MAEIISLHVKNGYRLNMTGRPAMELKISPRPENVAVLPERLPFIRPKLLVDVGEKVKIGTPLVEDKRNTAIKFLSPGGGEVTGINFGRRRSIREIIIHLDDEEAYLAFEKVDEKTIQGIDRTKLVSLLIKGGIWPFIKALPFRDIADPEGKPPAIILSLDNKEPFHPSPEVYLQGKENIFALGLAALEKLAPRVNVCVSSDCSSRPQWLEKYLTHIISGPYPATDPGVILYHTRKEAKENQSWYINGQDLLLLAELLLTGRYPVERIISIGGSLVHEGKHFMTRMGAPVRGLIPDDHTSNEISTCIAGGIFTGCAVPATSFMGYYETSLLLMPRGDEEAFLGFLDPGLQRPSHSRTFLSVFSKKPLAMDTGMHGEERACVNCGKCAEVCPVDILPQFTYKSIMADEIEEALGHGILDCVECGLCSYVCPSKIDLAYELKQGKKDYYKERQDE